MSIRRRVYGWAAVVGLAVGGVGVTALPAWSQSAQACYVSGNAPYTDYGFVHGVANRAGCGDNVELQSWIMADFAFWPDPQVGYGARRLVNGSVTGSGPCDREGRENYYTWARTDTGQGSESKRRALC